MADDRNTWADPKIVDDDRIDHTDLALRAAAEFVHRNESLHRHDHEGPVCVYCALVASNALRAAGHVKFTPVPGWKWTEHPDGKVFVGNQDIDREIEPYPCGPLYRLTELPGRFIGCFHPAWPDPLDLQGPRDAERWYREHVGDHPGIYVDRIASVRTRFLGPAQ